MGPSHCRQPPLRCRGLLTVDIIGHPLTQAGAAVVLLGMTFKLINLVFTRLGKGQAAEGSLDDRALKLGTAYDQMLDDKRIENKELRDELFKAYQRSFEVLQAQQQIVSEAVAQVRAEGKEAMRLMDIQITELRALHAECERRQEWAMNELRQLRNEQAAKKTPEPTPEPLAPTPKDLRTGVDRRDLPLQLQPE